MNRVKIIIMVLQAVITRLWALWKRQKSHSKEWKEVLKGLQAKSKKSPAGMDDQVKCLEVLAQYGIGHSVLNKIMSSGIYDMDGNYSYHTEIIEAVERDAPNLMRRGIRCPFQEKLGKLVGGKYCSEKCKDRKFMPSKYGKGYVSNYVYCQKGDA